MENELDIASEIWVFSSYGLAMQNVRTSTRLFIALFLLEYPNLSIRGVLTEHCWMPAQCLITHLTYEMVLCTHHGPVSLSRPSFPGMGIPMLKIRQSRDCLIFNMGIPILVRWHVYIETDSRRGLLIYFPDNREADNDIGHCQGIIRSMNTWGFPVLYC